MLGSRNKMSTGPVRRPWRFDFSIERSSAVSQETQLIRAIVQEIQRGRLTPGSALPGTRTLADQLGVNRKVLVAVVHELVAQGWLETRPASGTKVAATLPTMPAADAHIGVSRDGASRGSDSSLLVLTDGVPDSRLAPFSELARAYSRALLNVSKTAIGYCDAAGEEPLREVLSEFVNQARGLSTTRDDVFLTRGSQGALSLYALAMLKRGDVVAVESPGYVPAWTAFEFAGARVVHIPLDKHGIRTDVLAKLAQRMGSRLKAVYVTPHHQYPTSISMTPERRMALLQLAEKFGFSILEDDYDYEYNFEGEPLLPLHASGSQRVVYIASLSKLLAPSIRVGYIIAPPSCVRKLHAARTVIERQGDLVLERALVELFEDGTLQRHARKARRVYRERRDHLLQLLGGTPALRSALECTVPSGGLALWLQLRAGTIDELAARARRAKLQIVPGGAYLPKGALHAFRFGFAAHTTAELTRICALLARCVEVWG
jgi:GntR family transcriptional regulator / MocR family aminotransferase